MTIQKLFDDILDTIQAILMSFLVKLGPFFVALMPALFTGYAIYHTFKQDAGMELALFFALVVGLAMETVGIVATHTAIELYNAVQDEIVKPAKFWLMVLLIPVYVFGVAGVVAFSEDAFTPLIKGLGIASPFLTTIVYVSVALARDLTRIEHKRVSQDDKQTRIEQEERDWQRQKERLELELKHKERLAKITVKESVKKSVNFDSQTVSNDKQAKIDNLIDIYAQNPQESISQAAKRLNVSRQTVYNYLQELEQTGQISRNGEGVKVL